MLLNKQEFAYYHHHFFLFVHHLNRPRIDFLKPLGEISEFFWAVYVSLHIDLIRK